MPRITHLSRLCGGPGNVCYALLLLAAFLAGNQINWLGESTTSSSVSDDSRMSLQRGLRGFGRLRRNKETHSSYQDMQLPLSKETSMEDDNIHNSSNSEAVLDRWTPATTGAKLEQLKNVDNGTMSSLSNTWKARMDQVQIQRKATLASACKIYANQTFLTLEDFASNPENLASFMYNDKYKVVYNFVHKAASQHLATLLHRIDGVANPVPAKLYQHNRLYELSFGAVIMRLRTYKKFIFVRDPFARFVSAYKNKFIEYPDEQLQTAKQIALVIGKHYRAKKDKRKKKHRPEDVSFLEFIRYLTGHHYGNRANTHWSSYVNRNKVCLLKHDFIGKLETMEDDSKYFLNHVLQGDDKDNKDLFISSGRKKGSATRNTKLIRDMFSKIPKANMDKLFKFYKADFHIFGYSTTSAFDAV